MARVKASGIKTIAQIVAERGPAAEREFTAKLTPETLKTLQNSGSTSWIPFPAEAEVFEVASALLFPGEPQALRSLGYEVARRQFAGIYKVFLVVASVQFVVKRVSSLWDTIYDSGQARVDGFTAHGGTLVASGIPDQLPVQREYICGFLTGLLELTHSNNIRITKDEGDPQAWKWKIAWD